MSKPLCDKEIGKKDKQIKRMLLKRGTTKKSFKKSTAKKVSALSSESK